MYDFIASYLRFYKKYALESWADMGPSEYGYMLIGIGIFGWLLMKSNGRQ